MAHCRNPRGTEMFTDRFKAFVFEGDKIRCTVDGFACTATIYRDDCSDRPDQRQDGFWPSRDPNAAGYVLPGNFEAEQAKAERVMQAWQNDEWFYCGVAVTVARWDVELTGQFANALWGIECNYPDSDNSYLSDVANELLGEAIEQARAKIAQLCSDETETED
jgi:hypothetical protein